MTDGRARSGPNAAPISYERGDTPRRPPVLLGCGFMLMAVVALVGAGACTLVFLDSGANTGEVRLDDAGSYAPGSVEFIGEHNFFLVRTADGTFFALVDLDAANRANQGRRCRVQALPPRDAEVTAIQSRYQTAFSPQAAGLSIVFREDCNGAIYDATGVRLDVAGGRNLDRHRVELAEDGRVRVSTGARICSARSPHGWFDEVDC